MPTRPLVENRQSIDSTFRVTPEAAAPPETAPLCLVLLPGMDGTGDLFAPLVQSLADDMSVQVVRYPADRPADYDALTAYARTQLPKGIPIVLLGESFSGPIAIRLAAEAPANLRGLVLCCSFARNPQPALSWLRGLAPWLPIRAMPTWLMALFLLGRSSSPAWRTALARALTQSSPDVMRARMRAVLSVDASAQLRQVTVPTLYLRALQDRVVPASASRWVRQCRPETQIVELRGPHFLLQVAPAEAAMAIQGFVTTLTPRLQAPSGG